MEGYKPTAQGTNENNKNQVISSEILDKYFGEGIELGGPESESLRISLSELNEGDRFKDDLGREYEIIDSAGNFEKI